MAVICSTLSARMVRKVSDSAILDDEGQDQP